MGDFFDLVTADNLDDILDILEENQEFVSCDMLQMNRSEEGIKILSGDFLKMDSASDSQVSILKMLIKEKYSFGAAIKLWFSWERVRDKDQKYAKQFIAEKQEELKKLLTLPVNSELSADIEKKREELENYKNIFKQVQIKLSKKSMYQSLVYEKCVYSYITEHIIKKHVSPNFIPLLGYITCDLITIVNNLTRLKGVSEEKIEEYSDLFLLFPNLKVNMMITGSSAMNGGKLLKFRDFFKGLEKRMENWVDPTLKYYKRVLLDVLYQCIYSLAVMDYFGIVHNDFHFNNVFIHVLQTPVILQFEIPFTGQTVTLQTSYVVKFFDWDRAYVEKLGNNPLLYSFTSIHQINKARTKQDFYQLLCGLSNYSAIWEFILSKNILGDIPKKQSDYYYRERSDPYFDQYRVDFMSEKMKDFINREKSHVVLSPNNDEVYIEIGKIEFESMFPPHKLGVLTDIKNKIGIEHYNLAKRLYFNVSLAYRGQEILLTPRTLLRHVDSVLLTVLHGYACQSLYDTYDAKLPPPIHFIKSYQFNDFFHTPVSSSSPLHSFTYNFPTEPIESLIKDQKPCPL